MIIHECVMCVTFTDCVSVNFAVFIPKKNVIISNTSNKNGIFNPQSTVSIEQCGSGTTAPSADQPAEESLSFFQFSQNS